MITLVVMEEYVVKLIQIPILEVIIDHSGIILVVWRLQYENIQQLKTFEHSILNLLINLGGYFRWICTIFSLIAIFIDNKESPSSLLRFWCSLHKNRANMAYKQRWVPGKCCINTGKQKTNYSRHGFHWTRRCGWVSFYCRPERTSQIASK